MMFESSTKRKKSPTMLFLACLIFMEASSTSLITLSHKLKFDSKYTISNLRNGTEDTISDASNKGGNQVIIYLTGNINDDLFYNHNSQQHFCDCMWNSSWYNYFVCLENATGSAVTIDIDAPFYDDPRPPNGNPGEPYDQVIPNWKLLFDIEGPNWIHSFWLMFFSPL